MVDFSRDFWVRETGTGQQVAQLHDRYIMMIKSNINRIKSRHSWQHRWTGHASDEHSRLHSCFIFGKDSGSHLDTVIGCLHWIMLAVFLRLSTQLLQNNKIRSKKNLSCPFQFVIQVMIQKCDASITRTAITCYIAGEALDRHDTKKKIKQHLPNYLRHESWWEKKITIGKYCRFVHTNVSCCKHNFSCTKTFQVPVLFVVHFEISYG